MTRQKTWVVRASDGEVVDDIVTRLGADAGALDDGRVFIARKRAKRGMPVRVGDEVHVHERSPGGAGAGPEITILHRDAGILAVDKPAGMSTIPDERDAASSLLHRVARAAGLDPSELHPTSRLDRGVSGVVLFAENATAQARLRDARSSGQYARHYVALATAAVKRAEHGVWDARIGRARDPKKRAVNGRDATDAVTRFRTIATTPSYAQALLAIEPVTGRTHQIRVHASHAGEPLLGDRDYGGPRTLVLASGKVLTFGRIALHCARVAVAGLDIQAPIPDDLRAWWLALGGDDGAWSLSLG